MSGEVRIYLPLQPEHLIALQDGDELESGLQGFAVTEQIRRVSPGQDSDEHEFLALQQAATAARATGGPVVIGAADVPDTALSDVGRGAQGPTVEVGVPLEYTDFSSFHLDDVALGEPVATSITASEEAIDLSWYDVSEVSQVLRHLTT